MRLGPITVGLVAVTPAGTRDRYNTPEETAAAPVAIPGCRLDIEGAEESLDDRDTALVRGRLFVPYDATVTIDQHDHFVVPHPGGDRWEIRATVDLVDSHLGPHHYEIPVRMIEV